MLQTVIEAAEELNSPVIVGTAEVLLPYGELQLIAPAVIHARIDYKNFGIGSNSCGPALAEKYRLKEKDIYFSFYIS